MIALNILLLSLSVSWAENLVWPIKNRENEDIELPDDFSNCVVSIRFFQPTVYPGDNHFCTGLLFTGFFVLTAASCIIGKHKIALRSRQLEIAAGFTNRFDYSEEVHVSEVEHVNLHPQFLAWHQSNLALLRLEKPVDEDHPYIDVSPHTFIGNPVGYNCTAYGWGRIFLDGPLAHVMQKIHITIFPQSECRSYFGSRYNDSYMLCGSPSGDLEDQGPCAGATGGPLFCEGSLAGIITYPLGCNEAYFPSVFEKITTSLPWLYDVVDRGGQTKLQIPRPIFVTLLSFVLIFNFC